MTGEGSLRAAWAPRLEESRKRARANVEVHAPYLAELAKSSAPAELAERLVGIDAATAEAIVALPREESDELVVPLAAAARVAAPVLDEETEDVVAALAGLAVVSSWNDVLAAGHPELLPNDEPAAAWLDRAVSSARGDPELERRLVFVVPAVGGRPLLRELAQAGPSGAPVAQPEDLAPTLAAAVLERGTVGAVETEWEAWLRAAPEWLRSGMLEWQDLLWAARAVYARIGGGAPHAVAATLRAALLPEES